MDRKKSGPTTSSHRRDDDRVSSRHKHKSSHGESSRRRSPSPSDSSSEGRSRPRNKSSHRRKSPDTKKKRKDKKKRKHRSKSSSSASSDSSQGSVKLLQKLKDERVRQAEHRVQQKEVMKASETPEEKRLRRLLKKEAKERKRKERMGWDNDYLHYTNADNPFGDGNLLATFVWAKKLDKEGLTGVSREELDVRNRQKQEENKRELEKVKKRRQERELERQQREEEMSLMQRSKEAAQFQEWERQEDQFHLEQSRLRSCIRIQEGRAKPIDLLAKYVSAEGDVDAVEMHEPYTYLNGLAVKDLEDLIEDIKVYKELERGKNLGYWHDITVIVQDELHKLRKLERRSAYEAAVGRREGIHAAVAKDVASIFRGKTAAQLETLQSKIEAKIVAKAEGVDIGYWESLLSQLKAHMARARLRDRHQENLLHKLQLLKAQQGVAGAAEAAAGGVEVKSEPGADPEEEGEEAATTAEVKPEQDDEEEDEKPAVASTSAAATASSDSASDSEGSTQDGGGAETAAETLIATSLAEYEAGGYEPALLTVAQLEPGTLVVNEDDDLKRLAFARLRVTGPGVSAEAAMGAEEQSLLREARKGMAGDEAEFSVETTVDSQVYLWSDKYRPRKPRYFNRVHTGFEWNKYNQTHYDMDNPPPKIVQGYKFNIFYPDLIDKHTTPEYFLTACDDNRDFANLRFHAGPPYEDIAFKIVNREWEYSYKRGFRCQFHNNIFQLWFHFKRYRYRR